MGMSGILFFDSWAWLEILSNGPKGLKAVEKAERASEVLTNWVNIFEVLYRITETSGEPKAKASLAFIKEKARVVEISEAIALKASENKVNLKLHAIDALALASAQANNAILVTGDKDFKGIAGVEM